MRRQVRQGIHLQHDAAFRRIRRVQVRQVVINDAKEDTTVQQVQGILEEEGDGTCRRIREISILAGPRDGHGPTARRFLRPWLVRRTEDRVGPGVQ